MDKHPVLTLIIVLVLLVAAGFLLPPTQLGVAK